MKEIIDKISSYNLFNYLFPGIVFVAILREITSYDLVQENNFIGSFLYYFIGLTVSRFGSTVIRYLIKKASFVNFSSYEDYVTASKKDNKIELFSEVNNMYRTIISMFSLLLLARLWEYLNTFLKIPKEFSILLLLVILLVLFVFSYRRQTEFIKKRVEISKK